MYNWYCRIYILSTSKVLNPGIWTDSNTLYLCLCVSKI